MKPNKNMKKKEIKRMRAYQLYHQNSIKNTTKYNHWYEKSTHQWE